MIPIRISASPGDNDHIPGGHATIGTTAWAYHQWLDSWSWSCDEVTRDQCWVHFKAQMQEEGYQITDEQAPDS